MKVYSPETNKGRQMSADAADSRELGDTNWSKNVTKSLRHAARQDGKRRVDSELIELAGLPSSAYINLLNI